MTHLGDVLEQLTNLAKPTTSVHIVKRKSDRICISRERVQVFSNHPPTRTMRNDVTEVVRPKTVEYSCIPMTNQNAFTMESRAFSGENLETELSNLPIHFSTTEYEPEECYIEKLRQEHGDQQLRHRDERNKNIKNQNAMQTIRSNQKIQKQQQHQSQTHNNEHNNHI